MSDTSHGEHGLLANSSGKSRTRISFSIPESSGELSMAKAKLEGLMTIEDSEGDSESRGSSDNAMRWLTTDQIVADAEIGELVNDMKQDEATRMKSVLLNSSDEKIDSLVTDMIDEMVDNDRNRSSRVLKTALCVGLIVALLLGSGVYFGDLAFYTAGDMDQTDVAVVAQRSETLSNGQGNGLEDSTLIGSIQAPMDFKELLFLIKNDHQFDHEIFNRSLHFEATNSNGAVLHCGLAIAGISLLVECERDQDFCNVYGNAFVDGC